MGRHRRHDKRGRTRSTRMILIRHGQTEFNRVYSETRRDPWWAEEEESVEALARRCEIFCDRIARETWSEIAVVTHWGFIKAVTGLSVPNGAALRIDPTQPDRAAELLYLPDTA